MKIKNTIKRNNTFIVEESNTTIVDDARSIIYNGQYIWIADNNNNNIRIINPDTLEEVRTVTTSGRAIFLKRDGKYIWATNGQNLRINKYLY